MEKTEAGRRLQEIFFFFGFKRKYGEKGSLTYNSKERSLKKYVVLFLSPEIWNLRPLANVFKKECYTKTI